MKIKRNLNQIVMMACLSIFFGLPLAQARHDTFTLLKGGDIEVCNAYSKAIEKMKYETWPYCGRWSRNFNTDGFENMERIPLTQMEKYNLYDNLMAFTLFNDQDYRRVTTDPVSGQTIKRSMLGNTPEKSLKTLRQLPLLKPWHYKQAIDINNDGEADQVVVWYQGPCDETHRPDHELYSVDLSLSRVNEKLMYRVLGNKNQNWDSAPGLKKFKYIDHMMDVFNYKGKTYIEAYPAKVEIGSQVGHNDDLRIYLHEKNETHLICSFYWNEGEQQ